VVIVPRRTTSIIRFAPNLIVVLWPLWRRYALRIHPTWRREEFLATFAPFAIMFLLVTWVVVLVLGYGLAFHALADQVRPRIEDFGTALYMAGVSFLTLGYGDLVPVGMAARMLSLVAAASGLWLVALVISLAFNLYGSFARREVLVLLLDARAGVPPSGVTMLETFGREEMLSDLPDTFARYEAWTAEMLDSHLAYPLLPFFRSSHDGQSWVSAMGAVLDAATLLMTAVEGHGTNDARTIQKARAAAEMFYSIGCHAVIDLTQFPAARRQLRKLGESPGIERSEFVTACERLTAAGYRIGPPDEAWRAFAEHRSAYAPRLNLLARYFGTPPTQWIGDRSLVAYQHRHAERVG
jgi:hypothetical protein